MIDAIGADYGASAMMNAYLRELGGSPRGRARSGVDRVTAGQESQPVGGKSELTEEEKKEVDELKKRDREVRRHEAAHQAAAGQFAKGGPQFEYTRGPDGRQYASGGEVQIDASKVTGDPQATIRKMQQVRRAAAAPANPSGQDRKVAAEAARLEAQAKSDLSKQRRAGEQGNAPTPPANAPSSGVNAPRTTAAARFAAPRPLGAFIDVNA